MKRDKFGRFAPTTKCKATKKAAKKSVKRPVEKRKAAPKYKVGDLVFVREKLGYWFCNKMREMDIPAKVIEKSGRNFTISYGTIAGSNSDYTLYMTPGCLEKAPTPACNLGKFLDYKAKLRVVEDDDYNVRFDGKEVIAIGCNDFIPEHFKGFNAVVRAIMLQSSNFFGESFMTAFKEAVSISFKAEVIAK